MKLTPNITDIRHGARAAEKGGADGVSLINTINSIVGVDLDVMAPLPTVDGKGTHGGYCGPAVKPIALNMVAEIATDASRWSASMPAATRAGPITRTIRRTWAKHLRRADEVQQEPQSEHRERMSSGSSIH